MPDRDQILIAMAAAAAVSAVVAAGMSLAAGWPRRPLKPTLLTLGWVLGVSAGFYLGAVLLQVGPRKQLAEDRDRFLLLLIPAVIVVELITAWHRIPAWVAWVPRLIIAAVAARVLLHGSSWLPDPEDPDSTRRWTHEQTFLYLNALAADLIAVWILLSRLTRDEPGLSLAPTPGRGGGYRSVLPALALTCVGTAVTVMYSGSA